MGVRENMKSEPCGEHCANVPEAVRDKAQTMCHEMVHTRIKNKVPEACHGYLRAVVEMGRRVVRDSTVR